MFFTKIKQFSFVNKNNDTNVIAQQLLTNVTVVNTGFIVK